MTALISDAARAGAVSPSPPQRPWSSDSPAARRWGAVALAGIGLVLLVRQVLHATSVPGIDFVHVWNAGRYVLAGQGAYNDPFFTYPPSAALLLAPIGGLGYTLAKWGMLTTNVLAMGVATWLILRSVGRQRDPLAIGAALTSLGVLTASSSTLANGNVNGVLLLLEVGFVLTLLAGRPKSAGALLAASLAIKPVLAPLVLVLVVRRHWRATAIAVGVPMVLNALAAQVVPDAGSWLTVTVPYLASGAELLFNDSLVGAGYLLGLGSVPMLLTRLLVVAVGVWAWLQVSRTRRQDASTVFVEIGVLLSATFLLSSMSETYYTLFLLPSLAWLATRGHRWRWAAAGVVAAFFSSLQLGGIPTDVDSVNVTLALRPAIGWLALMLVFPVAARLAAGLRGMPTRASIVDLLGLSGAVAGTGADVPHHHDHALAGSAHRFTAISR